MTLLAMRETTTDPVAELHACVDRLSLQDPDRLGPDAKAEALESIGRVEAKLVAYKLRMLASADRSKVAESTGLANTGQWAARAVNADPVVVQRQVRLSQRLEECTITQVALTEGRLSADHAAVIVRADEQLPASVTITQRAVIEAALVAKAQMMPPQLLRRAARRALAEVESDLSVVDAHENALVRLANAPASRCMTTTTAP
jgi:hypothetical protein